MTQFLSLVGVQTSELTSIFVYLCVSIPLLLVFGYFALYQPLQAYMRHHKIISFQAFFTQEFHQDQNVALSIFLGAKILAAAIIISHAMVFNLM